MLKSYVFFIFLLALSGTLIASDIASECKQMNCSLSYAPGIIERAGSEGWDKENFTKSYAALKNACTAQCDESGKNAVLYFVQEFINSPFSKLNNTYMVDIVKTNAECSPECKKLVTTMLAELAPSGKNTDNLEYYKKVPDEYRPSEYARYQIFACQIPIFILRYNDMLKDKQKSAKLSAPISKKQVLAKPIYKSPSFFRFLIESPVGAFLNYIRLSLKHYLKI